MPEAALASLSLRGSRMLALDGLRGIAAMGVVLLHTFPRFSFWFWSFVDLFFVLSGFLITRILLESSADGRALRNFWIRRVLRIWPAYYAALLLALLVLFSARAAGLHWASGNLQPIWPYLLFVQFREAYMGDHTLFAGGLPTFFHSWSLAVEEQFYILWPFLIWLMRKRPLPLLLICVVVPLLSLLLRYQGWPPHVLISRADGLALGALLAVLLQGGHLRTAAAGWLLAVCGMTGFALVADYLYHGYALALLKPAQLARFSREADPTLLVSGFVLIYFSVIGALTSRRLAWLARGLEVAPLVWLGGISYAMYIFHVPVLVALEAVPGLHGMFRSLLVLLVTILLAWASFRWLESPFNRYKHRFPLK